MKFRKFLLWASVVRQIAWVRQLSIANWRRGIQTGLICRLSVTWRLFCRDYKWPSREAGTTGGSSQHRAPAGRTSDETRREDEDVEEHDHGTEPRTQFPVRYIPAFWAILMSDDSMAPRQTKEKTIELLNQDINRSPPELLEVKRLQLKISLINPDTTLQQDCLRDSDGMYVMKCCIGDGTEVPNVSPTNNFVTFVMQLT